MPKAPPPLLTLEPLIEAVQDGIVQAGWALSGLQKTTSHQFEGRWQGDSSRSAYLFFHREEMPEFVSIDVFLDETSKGLQGNIALVVEGPALATLPPMGEFLSRLAQASRESLPKGYRTPLTVRLRMDGPEEDPSDADSEIRLKLRIPSNAVGAGAAAVSALASSTVTAFERAIEHSAFVPLLIDGE
jgi:hypothetical protein